MYAPKQFREDRRDILLSAIGSIRLAALVVSDDGAIEAAHIPMMVHETATGALLLEGHVARGNPLWRMAETFPSALAIFQGPQAYVHPGWLATKRETGKAVPTWNYVAVHAHGRLSSVSDPAWLLRHLQELTDFHEAGRSEPWTVNDAPDGFIDGLVRGIVGLQLRVERLEGVWKMIQHHSDANRSGVIAGLSSSGRSADDQVAAIMRELEVQRSAT